MTRVVAAAVVAFAAWACCARASDTGVVNVTNTPRLAEGEEPMSVNPRNPLEMVVVANQWQATFPGPVNPFPGGNGFMGTGRLCVAGRRAHLARRAAGPGRHRPREGAATGERGVRARAGRGKELDRPWLAVDNSGGRRDGTVYLMYETTPFFPTPPEVLMKRSTDHGRTWSETVRVDNGIYTTQFNPRARPVVGADGVVYVVYDRAPVTNTIAPVPQLGTISLVVARSDDAGARTELRGGRIARPLVVRVRRGRLHRVPAVGVTARSATRLTTARRIRC